MQEKASAYVDRDHHRSGASGQEQNRGAGSVQNDSHSGRPEMKNGERSDQNSRDGEKNDSTFILLIMLILLSQGETDDKLLLALLYLLF